MLSSEHLRSFFLLVLLSSQSRFATSFDQPQIKFNVSLDHNSSSPGHLQQISLHCGWKNDTSASSHMPVFGSEQVSVLGSEKMSGQWGEGTFFITMGDMSNMTNYTSSVHKNGNISATFFIPRQGNFIGEFTCAYNSSGVSKNFTNNEANLVFAYVAADHETDSIFRSLFVLFFCLFLVTLTLLIISWVCILRKKSASEGKYAESHEQENKGPKVIEELPVKRLPVSPEETGDDLNIPSHPSPCMSDNCPCSSYQQKLLYSLKQGTILMPTQRLYPTIEMGPSVKLQGSLTSGSHTGVEMDQGYFSVTSNLPLKRAADVDSGYASVSLKLPPSETERSSERHDYIPRLALQVKNHCCHSEEEVEIETTQRSSPPVDLLANDAAGCLADLHSPASKLLVPQNHSTLPKDCQDTNHLKLYPDVPDEVLGLSKESDSNMGLIDPLDTIHLDSNGGRYANENHEVYVKFPKGFIPEGKTISVEVGVSFHSALATLLPLETRPVSPLVKLCVVGEPEIRFLKPVEVTLPHYLDIVDKEDIDEMELQFLKSRHGLYCFQKSDGVAMFKPRASTATLRTNHFCTFCITAKENISSKKINYRLVKVTPKHRMHQMWRVNFCVSYYLRTCLQVNQLYSEIS